MQRFLEGLAESKPPFQELNLNTTSKQESSLRYRLVVDADGLNILAKLPNWWNLLPLGAILTPHVKEMCRLTGLDQQSVVDNRIDLVREMANKWNCAVILKGAFSVVAAPGETTVVIPFATDSLAKAGTGDVLAGCIASLVAQGCSSFRAAYMGAYVHGLAGTIAAKHSASRSVLARDVIHNISGALSSIESNRISSGPAHN
jgi:NAD(P)H-hydrate epimerase